MKTIFKNIFALTAFFTVLISCSSDDNSGRNITGFGEAELYFDNGVNGDKLILGSSYTNSNGETLKINRFNYIISNIVLIKADGTEFIYPKEKSYFIVSQESRINTLHLENIPSGDYTKVKFGIGVDNQRYLEGETAQQEFWDYAVEHHLTWTWSTGYRFINFEGTFTSSENPNPLNFQIHQGSNTATDNYTEVTLDLPTTARVRTDVVPSIHIVTDLNKIADGTNKIVLANNLNASGNNASIMGGENLIKIKENTLNMFFVDHVHNGAGGDHD